MGDYVDIEGAYSSYIFLYGLLAILALGIFALTQEGTEDDDDSDSGGGGGLMQPI